MKTKHTPGPWIYQKGVEENRCYIWGGAPAPHRTFIGHIYATLHGKSNRSEEEANARLVIAAPDLLDALEEASALLDAIINNGQCAVFADITKGDMGNILSPAAMARAAIAKAKGA